MHRWKAHLEAAPRPNLGHSSLIFSHRPSPWHWHRSPLVRTATVTHIAAEPCRAICWRRARFAPSPPVHALALRDSRCTVDHFAKTGSGRKTGTYSKYSKSSIQLSSPSFALKRAQSPVMRAARRRGSTREAGAVPATRPPGAMFGHRQPRVILPVTRARAPLGGQSRDSPRHRW